MDEELEARAVEVIDRLMDAVALGDRDAVGRALDGAPLVRVCVGLAYGLYQQETSNAVLDRQVRMLDNANAALFGERRRLREQVAELRDIMRDRTAASTATQRTRGKVA